MKLPKAINILGRPFRVETRERFEKAGVMNTGKQHIIINIGEEVADDFVVDTLLHEVLHAADELLQLKLKHGQVYRLAAVLTQVLRDNPELVKVFAK